MLLRGECVQIADALQEWHACTLARCVSSLLISTLYSSCRSVTLGFSNCPYEIIMWVVEITVVTPDYFQWHSAFQLVCITFLSHNVTSRSIFYPLCLERWPHMFSSKTIFLSCGVLSVPWECISVWIRNTTFGRETGFLFCKTQSLCIIIGAKWHLVKFHCFCAIYSC